MVVLKKLQTKNMKKMGFFLLIIMDLHEEACKENEQTLANLGSPEETASFELRASGGSK